MKRKSRFFVEGFEGLVGVSDVAAARADMSVSSMKLPVGVCYRKDRNCFSAYVHTYEDGKQKQIRKDCATLAEAVEARRAMKLQYVPGSPKGAPAPFARTALVPVQRNEYSLMESVSVASGVIGWFASRGLKSGMNCRVLSAGRRVSVRRALGIAIGRFLVDVQAAVMVGAIRPDHVREGFLERVQEVRERELLKGK
jgi:hypothetical protein